MYKHSITIYSIVIFMVLLFCGCGATQAQSTAYSVSVDDYYTFRELKEPNYIPASDGIAIGSGTEEDPYIISTAEELSFLSEVMQDYNTAKDYGNCYYELGNDIILNEGDASEWDENPPAYSWRPIAMHILEGGYFEGHSMGKDIVLAECLLTLIIIWGIRRG